MIRIGSLAPHDSAPVIIGRAYTRDDYFFRRQQSQRMADTPWANDNASSAVRWLRDIAAGICLVAFIAAAYVWVPVAQDAIDQLTRML